MRSDAALDELEQQELEAAEREAAERIREREKSHQLKLKYTRGKKQADCGNTSNADIGCDSDSGGGSSGGGWKRGFLTAKPKSKAKGVAHSTDPSNGPSQTHPLSSSSVPSTSPSSLSSTTYISPSPPLFPSRRSTHDTQDGAYLEMSFPSVGGSLMDPPSSPSPVQSIAYTQPPRKPSVPSSLTLPSRSDGRVSLGPSPAPVLHDKSADCAADSLAMGTKGVKKKASPRPMAFTGSVMERFP